MKKLLKLTISSLCIIAGSLSLTTAMAQEKSLVAPEVLDIDDPFRRGLDRIADQATGGVLLPAPDGGDEEIAASGAELLGKQDNTALMAQSYRVVGVAVSRAEAQAQIFSATNQDVMPGDKPMLAYVRIGAFEDQSLARQAAINLKSTIEPLLGAHFVMRDQELEGTILDIGPLRSVVHAERYCELLLAKSNGIVSECYAVLEYPGIEPTDTFTSKAMIKSAASAVRDIVKDDGLFDLQAASSKLITLREGETLGAGDTNIVKITPTGIIIVAENGDIAELPINYVPEAPFKMAAASQPDVIPNVGVTPPNAGATPPNAGPAPAAN